MWVFRWVRIAHRLWLICSVIKETSWSFFLEKNHLVIEGFSSTSRNLDDLLSIDKKYIDGLIKQIYPSELQSNKANSSKTETPFLDWHLSILEGFISCKIHDKRDDFDFEIVNFPYLDRDIPRRASYDVYILQQIRIVRVSSHVTDFNAWNKLLPAEVLNQDYQYNKLRKAVSKFCRRQFDLVSKFNVGLKSLLQQGLW